MQGTCDQRFGVVREAFERNFRDGDEVGAAVCVVIDSRVVVDGWGGFADATPETAPSSTRSTTPWVRSRRRRIYGAGMELQRATAEIYLRHGFGQMLEAADRLGDDLVNVRPHGPTTNSVAALVVHCCELTKFWLGHVGLGKPNKRDRDREFEATATVAELHTRVEEAIAQALVDIDQMCDGVTALDNEVRQFLPGGDTSDASVLLHVIEEIFQHVGHMELTVDALSSSTS